MKRKTNEQFIIESNKIHNNKYDYSLVEYINNRTKVKIICPVHGIFEQTPKNHLEGKKCIKCYIDNKTLTTSDFIKKSKKIHSNKYDYSLVNYINAKTKVKIICPIHGMFEQTPNNHISKKENCPNCVNNIKKTIENFIKESKITHGDKYDYSLVKYINNITKVKIICPIHGIFEQTPSKHINGNNCSKCSNNIKKTTEQFIKESKITHGNKYDYSISNYISAHKKIKIKCFKHGIFEQTASSHINGKGCPKCNYSKGEYNIEKILNKNNIKYIIQKKFKNCKYKKLLKFDFYLIDYNTCIEYDGIQHYQKYGFENNNNNLKIRQKRDQIKTKYCQENKINLIRIKYNDNINEKLNVFLNNE